MGRSFEHITSLLRAAAKCNNRMATTLQIDDNGIPSYEKLDGMETMVTDGRPDSSVPSQEYDPYSFSKEVERLDNMQKTLNDVKQKLYQANMQSLLLNADIVTMFDPVSTEELKKVAMDCTHCAERIKHMQRSDIEELQQGGSQEVKGQSDEEHSCNQDNGELETES